MSTSEAPQSPNIPPLTLGVRLYVSLQYAEVSRDDIAAHLGVNPATISRWMHDNFIRPPSRGNLLAWADRCGVRADWLIDGIGEMPTPPAFPRPVTVSDSTGPKRPGKARTRRNSVYNSAGLTAVAA